MPSKLGGLPQLSEDTPALQPAPPVSSDEAVAAFSKLADQAKALIQPFQQQQAEDAGNEAVSRDAQGNLQAKTIPVVGPMSEAYMHAAQLRYLSESQLDVRAQLADMKTKYAGNPEGFRTALDGAIAGKVKGAPSDFAPALRDMYLRDGAQVYEELSNQKYALDMQKARDSVGALQEQDENTLFGYAASGQLNTPQAQAVFSGWKARLQAQKDNPAFNMSQEEVDQKTSTLRSELTVASLRGQAGDWLNRYGRREAESRLEKAVDDPQLNLSLPERNRFLSEGLQEIRMKDALNRQDEAQAQKQVEYAQDDAYKLALSQGAEARQSFLSDSQIYAAYPHNRAHAEQIIEHLNQGAAEYKSGIALRLASPQERQDYLATLDPRNGRTPPPAPKMSVGQAIFGQESNFGRNAGLSMDGSSTGPMQIRPETFAQYAQPGESIDNPQDNIAVGNRIVDDYAQRYGGDPARVATAYFSGPGNVAPAGSATPYLHDYADANGKHVSSYVSDVLTRMGTASAQQDYAARWNVYQAAVNANLKIQKQLHDDPAAYMIANVPGLQDQLSSKDPATFQSGVRTLLANEQRMGAAPTILTAPMKQNILGSFSNPPEGTSKAQNTLNVLNQLHATYGSYYPQVMAELSRGGKMPSEVTGLDWVRTGAPVVANRMSDAVNTGRAALSKLIPDNGESLKAGVNKALAPFYATLKYSGGSALASQMAQSVQLYAMQLVAEGVDASTAATQAAQDVVGNNFHIAGTYRIPISNGHPAADPGTVAHATAVLQNGLSAANAEPFVPAKGVSFAERQSVSARILQSSGVWLTLPDNSGLYLAWPAENGYARARNAGGQPIQYSWAQLQAIGEGGIASQDLERSLGTPPPPVMLGLHAR